MKPTDQPVPLALVAGRVLVVGPARGDAARPPRLNRRASCRLGLQANVRVECRRGTLGLGPDLARRALDVSETGLRLLLKESLGPGQQVEVLLHGPGGRPLKRGARVVWSRPAAGGWQAGLAFDRPLPYADVQSLARPPRVIR